MKNKDLKILAIDDNADNLFLIKILINEFFEGSQVFTENNGNDGIRAALDHDPDVILLDIIMPGLDGYQTCQKLKTDDRLKDIPVVFVTALKNNQTSRIKALESGAEGFLSKPIDEAEIIAQIKAMASIKAARTLARNRETELAHLVEEKTKDLKLAHSATLDLLFELDKENEARKKSEKALKESEEKFRSLFENSMDAILLTRPSGQIISANAAACEMFAATPDQLIHEGCDLILDKNDERLSRIYNRLNETGKSKGEVQLRRVDGSFFTAELSSATFENSLGETYISTVIRDITEKITTRQTIDNERLLLRTLINNIPDSIYCKDLECRKTLVNTTELKFTGRHSEEEILGKTDFDVYPTELAEKFYADDQSILQSGIPVLNHEEYIIDENNEKKWLLTSKLPLRDSKGKIIGLIGIGRDITELKQRELIQNMQYHIASAIASSKSLQELFSLIKSELNQFIEAQNIILATVDHKTNMLISQVQSDETGLIPNTWPIDSSLTGLVVRQKESRLFTKTQINQLLESNQINSYGPTAECLMAIPLVDGNITLGVIILQSYTNPNAYDENSMRIVETIASQLSSYIKRLNVEQTALKLTKVVEQSTDAILIFDTSGIIEYANPKVAEVTGYTAVELVGQSARMLNPERKRKTIHNMVHESIASGTEWHGEILNRKKDGARYWISTSISPLFNNKGKITHYIVAMEDVTEKKMNEQALKHHVALQSTLISIASAYINANMENLNSIVENSLELMGKFASADRAYIFEYNWDQNTCSNTFEWCAKGITAQIDNLQDLDLNELQPVTDAHRKGNLFYIDDVRSLPSGDPLRKMMEPQDIKSLITIPLIDQGTCRGFVGFDWVKRLHSYSDSEKVLLTVFSQMLINMKLKMKLQRNLVIEKENAQAADRLKTAFLNNISHEVRTPLNGILGFGEMMIQEDISHAERISYYKILQKSSKRLVNTITSYMDISLITSGNLQISRKKFPLQDLMNQVQQYVQHEFAGNGILIQYTPDPEAGKLSLQSDAGLLYKVWIHLIDNAMKFTKEGSVEYGYRIKQDQVEFFIRDTGIGIDQAMISKVFDHFIQEDTSLSRGYEGSGLGLSISKGIISLLGGEIRIGSEKGKGTTVSFSVPGVEAEKKAPMPVALEKNTENSLILIAEDDRVNQYYLQMILRLANLDHIVVENGLDAVEAIRMNNHIGLVLMDLKMPVLGGLEATRRIKQIRPGLPVMAITAYAMTGDRENALEAGCDDYLAKPFSKAHLLERINTLMSEK